MKFNEVFTSKYLKHSDLNGKKIVVTIADCTVENLKTQAGGTERKFMLSFREDVKPFLLNMTNSAKLVEITGSDDSDDWANLPITLFPTKVLFGQKMVDTIRIEKAQKARPATAITPADEQTEVEDF